jgi:PAS domain S-box-containing protein
MLNNGERARPASTNPASWEAMGRLADLATQQLVAILESSGDALIGQTLGGTITSWNPAAQGLFGWSAAEAVGRLVSLLVPPERRDELAAIDRRLRRGERIEPYETARVRKDGTRVEVSLTVSPVRDSSGTVVAAFVIARDLTERKRAEQALRRQIRLLQSAFARRRVARGIA